jgi:RNA 3'-terminal phosphate cyclase (ATP)
MKTDSRRIEVNGSHGEGGGALLRTALQMSALTQQNLLIHNIRGAMRKPGLNAEDLTFLHALGESCGFNTEDISLGDERLEFLPKHPPRRLKAALDIHSHEKGISPGSAMVVGHSLIPVLARAGACSRLTIYGETHGSNVLCADALETATLHVHRRQGLYATLAVQQAGFGYGSRGESVIEVEPSVLEPLPWTTRGRLLDAGFVLAWHGVSEAAVERQAHICSEFLASKSIEGEPVVLPITAREPGASLTVWAHYEKGCGSGTATVGKGLALDQLATTACRSFFEWHDTGATLDPYLADQALVPAALADGRSSWTTSQVTRRLITMAFVIKQFLPIKITILGREGEPGTVTVER